MTKRRYQTELRFVQDFPCRNKFKLRIADLLINLAARIMGAYDVEIESNMQRKQ